ncbi:MAG TPA: hypothetical protein VFL87_09835, partial [Thermoleophilaceae bacterium]|nr:hypothetical protein [Thermoleophilaceae bacterium]
MRIAKSLSAAVGVGALAIAVAACGSSGGGSSSTTSGGGGGGASTAPKLTGGANVAINQGQQKGGTLNLISNEGWEHLDPGQSYFQIDYLVVYATQRPLYSFDPSGKTMPDVASGPPIISKDGKTVTVHIKPNIKFSPPVNR